MEAKLLRLYRVLFARRGCYRFNLMLYELAVRGLGIRNYEDDYLSGEAWFISNLACVESPVVIDVGANVGDYCRQLLHVSPSARIIAVEAHPDNFRMLTSAPELAGVTAINSAAGAKPGELVLYDYDRTVGSQHASLYRDVIEGLHSAPARAIPVPVTTVDAIADTAGVTRVDLLKIDVEGNEYQVLLGAAGLLERGAIAVIHFEFNEMNVASRTFFRDFVTLLGEYRLFRLLPRGLLPLGEYSAAQHEIFSYQNIVAVRDGAWLET